MTDSVKSTDQEMEHERALVERCEKKIIATRIYLLKEAPFFGSLTTRLRPTPTRVGALGTMGVMADGRLMYDPKFVDEISMKVLAGAMAHEVLHLAGDVFGRRGDRHHMIWNFAHDYAINPMVRDAGLELPEGVLLDAKYDGMAAEQIYEHIKEEIRKNSQKKGKCSNCEGSGKEPGSPDCSDCGGVGEGCDTCDGKGVDPNAPNCSECGGTGMDFSNPLGFEGSGCADHHHPDNKKAAEGMSDGMTAEDWKAAVAEAAEAARRMGRLPAGVERWLGDIMQPKLDWRQILSRATYKALHTASTSWRRPARRSWAAGVYLPTWDREGRDATVALDTSGSIGPAELARFGSETEEIIKQAGGNVRVFCCDAEVATEVDVSSVKDVPIRGGGGTSFVPVFQRLAEQRERRTAMLIYFTDLMGSFPSEAPPYPVIWAVPDDLRNHNLKEPPFGSVLYVPVGSKDL